MKGLLMRCASCKRYTLQREKCPHCGGAVKSPHPPRYSPHDKYAMYRLKARLEGEEG
ncbi:MAG: RNA-protein complex protein Nop10 [Candidatus Nezhaarchaeota archaeon]|nr:RNA-protein complex protein Nop10 [Candidatus Nezhaarchaeota archaeon]